MKKSRPYSRWMMVLGVLLLLASCARSAAGAIDQAGGSTGRTATAASSDGVSSEPTGVAEVSSPPKTSEAGLIYDYDASCPDPANPSTHLPARAHKVAAEGGSWVVGTATLTKNVWTGETGPTFTAVDITVEQTIYGPTAPARLVGYLPGGEDADRLTVVGDLSENSFGADGKFFGTVVPDNPVVGGYGLHTLPLTDGSVFFPDVSCWYPQGLLPPDQLLISSQRVQQTNDGSTVEKDIDGVSVPLTVIMAALTT